MNLSLPAVMARHRKVMALLAGIFIFACLFIAFRNGGLSGLKEADTTSSSFKRPRGSSSYKEKLSEAVAAFKTSNRGAGSSKEGYKLSRSEIDEFLEKRGKTPASLLFVLICSEDRTFLDTLKDLPDSPMKLHILTAYCDKEEKLAHATKLFEIEPGNKISGLRLANAMLANGKDSEAGEILAHLSDCPTTNGYQNLVTREFSAACDLFGDKRGYQLLESHGRDWTTWLSNECSRLYLDSLDPKSFGAGDDFDSRAVLSTTEDFLSDIGFSTIFSREEALRHARDYIGYINKQDTSLHLEGAMKEMDAELNSEFLNGFKKMTALNEMTDVARGAYIMKSLKGE